MVREKRLKQSNQGCNMHKILVGGNEKQPVAWLKHLLDEKISGDRMLRINDVDKGLHHFLMAAMPGSSLPSMASSKAPPPVLT